jgi:hypothetical protein
MSAMYLMLTDQFATTFLTKNLSRITAWSSPDGDSFCIINDRVSIRSGATTGYTARTILKGDRTFLDSTHRPPLARCSADRLIPNLKAFHNPSWLLALFELLGSLQFVMACFKPFAMSLSGGL